MNEIDEFKKWLKDNRRTLAWRSSSDVAGLAMTCGFSVDVIVKVLSEFRDAMQGTQVEARFRFQYDVLMEVVNDRAGNPCLKDQWHALWKYQEFDEGFEDAA